MAKIIKEATSLAADLYIKAKQPKKVLAKGR
jgi:hypothetical protein